MAIYKRHKVKLKISVAKKAIEKLNKEKLKINKDITTQEDVLREARKECPHPPRFIKNTQMSDFKKCTICEDILFRP